MTKEIDSTKSMATIVYLVEQLMFVVEIAQRYDVLFDEVEIRFAESPSKQLEYSQKTILVRTSLLE